MDVRKEGRVRKGGMEGGDGRLRKIKEGGDGCKEGRKEG